MPKLKLEAIVEKIKVLAQRKAYFGPIEKNRIFELDEKSSTLVVNPHEDVTSTGVWFWELVTLDYISKDHQGDAKKTRSALRKLASFFKACRQLLITIETCRDTTALDAKLSAKLAEQEEKILKYEREVEKQRVITAKKKIEMETKVMSLEQKKVERDAAKVIKKLENEAAKATRKTEMETKRQKIKEEKEKEQKVKEEEARKKKKAALEAEVKLTERNKQFFAGFLKKSPVPVKNTEVLMAIVVDEEFDSAAFRDNLGKHAQTMSTQAMFQKLSSSAIKSKQKTVKRFPMKVDVVPDDPVNCFEAIGAYSEERTVFIRDKMKHLQFAADYRPPYHGTW